LRYPLRYRCPSSCWGGRFSWGEAVGNKKLFDDEVEHYGGPATDTESSFHFLNRAQDSSWQKVREVLDEWYSHHPDPGGDLRSRFQQYDNRQHTSAWWELYTHALFRRLASIFRERLDC
jgi:hypothetical protein